MIMSQKYIMWSRNPLPGWCINIAQNNMEIPPFFARCWGHNTILMCIYSIFCILSSPGCEMIIAQKYGWLSLSLSLWKNPLPCWYKYCKKNFYKLFFFCFMLCPHCFLSPRDGKLPWHKNMGLSFHYIMWRMWNLLPCCYF
jgi:hypothetical protein